MDMNQVKKKIMLELKKEIAIDNFQKEERVMEKNNKMKFSKISQIAASVATLFFLVGNGVAYAKGAPNVYTWLFHLPQKYQTEHMEIDQTVEDNGFKITVQDIGYDSNVFIIGYKIEDLKGKIEKQNIENQKELEEAVVKFQKEENRGIWESLYLKCHYTLYTKHRTLEMNKMLHEGEETVNYLDDSRVWKKENNQYILYEIYDISQADLKEEIEAISIKIDSIHCLEYDNALEEDPAYGNSITRGTWNFKINQIDTKYQQSKKQVIAINQNINHVFQIDSMEIISGKMADSIKVNSNIAYQHLGIVEAGEFMYDYRIDITDQKHHLIGTYPSTQVDGSIYTDYYLIDHLEANQEYTLQISKYEQTSETKIVLANIPFKISQGK